MVAKGKGRQAADDLDDAEDEMSQAIECVVEMGQASRLCSAASSWGMPGRPYHRPTGARES